MKKLICVIMMVCVLLVGSIAVYASAANNTKDPGAIAMTRPDPDEDFSVTTTRPDPDEDF